MSVGCPLSQWLARLDVIFDEYDIAWRYLQGCIPFVHIYIYLRLVVGLCSMMPHVISSL